MPSLSNILTGIGALLMAHSAYSCLHYRSLLMDLDLVDTFAIPPFDVYVEVAASFLILLFSQMIHIGTLQSVEITSGGQKRRPLKAPAYKTRDFDIYEYRCRSLNTTTSKSSNTTTTESSSNIDKID